MRIESFLDLYVEENTWIRILCEQDPDIFFEGYKKDIPNYPEIAEITGELGLWLGSVYSEDNVLVIVASY